MGGRVGTSARVVYENQGCVAEKDYNITSLGGYFFTANVAYSTERLDIGISAPHTEQSSQLSFDPNNSGAEFLPNALIH